MEEIDIKIAPYAQVIVKLLRGVIYDTDNEWKDLIHFFIPVSDYFRQIGVELITDKKDGYAFLKQVDLDGNGKTIGLIRKQPLSYEVSLLLVLIREWIDEFEINDTDSRDLFITRKDLKDRIELFFKEKSNQVRFMDNIDRFINEIEGLGFLKRIKTDDLKKDAEQFKVQRIIKAKITNDKLEEFRKGLQKDAESI